MLRWVHPWLKYAPGWRVLPVMLLMSLAALISAAACAADPLYLSRPYDEIALDENNAGVRLKVQPLHLPGRKMPAAADRKDDLEIELVDRPGERFRVGWNNVAGIKFFEELVLAEAEGHVKAGRFDEAYPYFQFLETRYPQTAGLKEAVENFLWAQIGSDYTAGRNGAALALLVELHERNPQRQGLSVAFERVTVKLVDERMAAENYRAAWGLLRNLTQRFPDAASTAATYEAQMHDQAAARLTAARSALAGGKFREAHQQARQALGIWPKLEGGRELAEEVHQRYATVVVAVIDAVRANGDRSGDRAARRTRPLSSPQLFERAPAAGDNSPYRSRFGEIAESNDPRQVLFRLRPDALAPASSRLITAHDAARSLLAAADPRQAAFDPPWGDLLASILVRGQDELQIELTRPPLRPEAWLGQSLANAGPYRIDSQSPEQVIFVRQLAAPASGPSPPSEIVERTYADPAAALRALKRGEVSILDRVSPWELKPLAASNEIVVGRYALPSVHVLVPNSKRPLAANRTLKRAILYGIDRESILRRSLLDGQTIAGCQLVSGPFPRGEAKNDPHGYAYDENVDVRAYDPGLALALARLSAQEGQNEPASASAAAKPLPPLVLDIPAEPVARVACQSIARQLGAVGIPVTLRELNSGQTVGENYDLLYVELPMQEPLVDVWRVLGPQGIAGPPSPALLAALRDLESAADWPQASDKLKAIHALAAAELPVIPLWQLVDHFAHHASLNGVGQRPVSLYQNVDQWQVELRLPSE